MSNPFQLTGRVAVVTGAAQGLGAAVAAALAKQGAAVALLDLQVEAVEKIADDLRLSTGQKVLPLGCDVRDAGQVEHCIAEIVAKFGRIDILVNNAGIHRRGTPTDYKPDDLTDVFAVNLVGCYHVVGAVGKVMIPQQSGSIINVSALGGGVLGLGRGGSIYGMTKGGIVSLTRDLAAEWGKHNIRVNAIAPGWIRTPMTNALQHDPVRSAKVLERVPLRRWGEPADVAGVVTFLASDAAAYVTGCTIPIDGGAANTIMLMME
ncbi:MAG TPA: SDR family NAD(P)-dependent oxidoreductase [Planctomycetaceae bacterium]|nr:SDR family NAD(P)-dependent oxidoreductase [Planctomycetaceae bacterium]